MTAHDTTPLKTIHTRLPEGHNELKDAQALAKTKPLPKELEEEVRTLIRKLREEAESSSQASKKKYTEALWNINLALDLCPDDRELQEKKREITRLSVAPETANISGTWKTPSGETITFTDDGRDAIAVAATSLAGNKSCTGQWKREVDKPYNLSGSLTITYPNGSVAHGTLHATIDDAKTLSVTWESTNWIDGTKEKGRIWTKVGPE